MFVPCDFPESRRPSGEKHTRSVQVHLPSRMIRECEGSTIVRRLFLDKFHPIADLKAGAGDGRAHGCGVIHIRRLDHSDGVGELM